MLNPVLYSVVIFSQQQRLESANDQTGAFAADLGNKSLQIHIAHIASQAAKGIATGPGAAAVPVLSQK
jgi:hypothetical protein